VKLLGVVGVAAVLLAGCGGQVAEDGELDVADGETSSAISSPDPGAAAAGDTGDGDDADEPTDKDCNDRDHEKHHKHHHHKFKVLDRLDGTKDRVITIASLPAGLPDRLIAKLHKLDANGDGLVTRAEVKAHRHR
jgi:hypothetical protein